MKLREKNLLKRKEENLRQSTKQERFGKTMVEIHSRFQCLWQFFGYIYFASERQEAAVGRYSFQVFFFFRCSLKEVFLKISEFSQENICAGVSLCF